ncbi:hypothetical protein BH09PLA1_BH09PLA1_08000 [soil metagenome]
MFAIIVLGIGFILIAAIFPVSISQSRLTIDETTAAANARSALAFTSKIADGGDVVINGPLLPTNDLYYAAPNGYADPAVAVGTFDVPANSQIRVGKVLSFNDNRLSNAPINYPLNLWNAIKGSIVLPSDNRYAWVPLYRRDMVYQNTTNSPLTNISSTTIGPLLLSGALLATPSPYAQVYFLPVAVRNRSTFDTTALSTDLAPYTGTAQSPGNLLPRRVQVQIAYSVTAGDYVIQFGTTPEADSVAPGCFVVISDDRITSPVQDIGIMNGRIYRVGNQRTDLDASGHIWELAPGSSFAPDPGGNGRLYHSASNNTDDDDVLALGNIAVPPVPPGAQYVPAPANCAVTTTGYADAFIVGRSFVGGGGGFEGVSQDVSAYVTFVKAN